MPEQGKPAPFGIDQETGQEWLYRAIQAHGFCVSAMLHKRMGIDHIRHCGFWSMLLMIVVFMCSADPAIMAYFSIWFCVVSRHRAEASRAIRLGVKRHTFYDGEPVLALMLPLVGTEARARLVEPLFAFLAGVLLMSLSPALGGFIAIGAFSLGALESLTRAILERRVRDIANKQIEGDIISQAVQARIEHWQ
jgi:hypothetical protein